MRSRTTVFSTWLWTSRRSSSACGTGGPARASFATVFVFHMRSDFGAPPPPPMWQHSGASLSVGRRSPFSGLYVSRVLRSCLRDRIALGLCAYWWGCSHTHVMHIHLVVGDCSKADHMRKRSGKVSRGAPFASTRMASGTCVSATDSRWHARHCFVVLYGRLGTDRRLPSSRKAAATYLGFGRASQRRFTRSGAHRRSKWQRSRSGRSHGWFAGGKCGLCSQYSCRCGMPIASRTWPAPS